MTVIQYKIRTDLVEKMARFLADNGVTVSTQINQVSAEAGEVNEAWIRLIGENPWKGPGTEDELLGELADVAIAAMVGIARLGNEPAQLINTKLNKMSGKIDAALGA